LTAILGQIPEQSIHRFEARVVDHHATLATHGNKAGLAEPVEMESQRVGRDIESLGYLPGRHALRSRLNEQPEDVETAVLRKRGQSRDGILLFHISMDIEVVSASQVLFRQRSKRSGLLTRFWVNV
jgi:hypothetical protein